MVQYSHRGIKITPRSTGTVSGVKRKAPEEGHRTLGFQISGDGKCIAQKKAMKEKSILFVEAIRSSTMWRGESGMAYNSFFYAEPGIWDTSHDIEKARLSGNTVTRCECNSSKDGHCSVSSESHRLWNSVVWRTEPNAPRRIARTYKTSISLVTFKML
jgi:hypothetical protein